MTKTTIIILLNIVTQLTYGQTDFNKRKSIFLEIAGNGGIGFINFENHFFKKKNAEFTWRAGLSLAPIDKNNGTGNHHKYGLREGLS